VLCSGIIHSFNNFAPAFSISQNVFNQNYVFIHREFLFLFWFVKMIIPSFSAWFRCSKNFSFSLEKYHFCDIIPIVEGLRVLWIFFQCIYSIYQKLIFFFTPISVGSNCSREISKLKVEKDSLFIVKNWRQWLKVILSLNKGKIITISVMESLFRYRKHIINQTNSLLSPSFQFVGRISIYSRLYLNQTYFTFFWGNRSFCEFLLGINWQHWTDVNRRFSWKKKEFNQFFPCCRQEQWFNWEFKDETLTN